MTFVYKDPTKRYTVDVNFGTYTDRKIQCVLETDDYEQAVDTANRFDLRRDTYFTDWTRAHWTERLERKFDFLETYIKAGAPKRWHPDGHRLW
jgi:hypothetical protein